MQVFCVFWSRSPATAGVQRGEGKGWVPAFAGKQLRWRSTPYPARLRTMPDSAPLRSITTPSKWAIGPGLLIR